MQEKMVRNRGDQSERSKKRNVMMLMSAQHAMELMERMMRDKCTPVAAEATDNSFICE